MSLKNWMLNIKLRFVELRCNNDLYLAWELGPRPFPTRDLKRFLRLIREESERVNYLRDRFFRLGASGILLISLSFLVRYFGFPQLSTVMILGAPLTMVGYLIGMGYIRWAFPTYIHGPVLREAIEKELDRRQKDASIL